jgi:hypothetical protein
VVNNKLMQGRVLDRERRTLTLEREEGARGRHKLGPMNRRSSHFVPPCGRPRLEHRMYKPQRHSSTLHKLHMKHQVTSFPFG